MKPEKTFRTSRFKALLLLVGAGLFAWAGYFMAASQPLVGWAIVLFFGACALMGALLLIKGGASLRLDEEGFEIVGVFKRSHFRWADIESIRMAKIRGASVIALNYKTGDPRRSHVSRSLTGMDATVGNIYDSLVAALFAGLLFAATAGIAAETATSGWPAKVVTMEEMRPLTPFQLKVMGVVEKGQVKGPAVLRAHVTADGTVANTMLIETCGNADLDESAIRAMRVMKFRPYTQEAGAMEVTLVVPVHVPKRLGRTD